MKNISLVFSTLLMFLLVGCSASTLLEQAINERPDWVDNAQVKYPSDVYLTAVGEGSSRVRSSKNAITNLAEIFSVSVRAETKTLSSSIKQQSSLGVTLESTTSLQRHIETETEQTIEGVEIKESWLSPTGEYYTLAVLQKRNAARNLTESILEFDQKIQELIDYSRKTAPNSILALNALRSARDLQVTREMSNSQLKYLNGSGVLNDFSIEDIEQLIRQQLASLQISVERESGEDKNALQAALSGLGVTVVEQSGVQIASVMDFNEATFVNNWYWLRGSYQLTISEDGKVISRKRWPVKVSSKQKELLAPRLQDKLNANMTQYLQQLFSDAPTL